MEYSEKLQKNARLIPTAKQTPFCGESKKERTESFSGDSMRIYRILRWITSSIKDFSIGSERPKRRGAPNTIIVQGSTRRASTIYAQ